MRDGRVIPVQVFNGKEYHLYPGERYFSRHNKRLHRVVWEYYNGPIPKWCHVHHKDGNTWNNDIENLELITGKLHLSKHTSDRVAEDPEQFRRNMHKAMEAAKGWHKSAAGREWHREHARSQGFGNGEKVEYICDQCGNPFLDKKRNYKHHFCSRKCAAAWRRASGLDDVTRPCEWCGKEFRSNKYDRQRFCSNACSAAYRKHQRQQGKD